jgi:hypothetical protein
MTKALSAIKAALEAEGIEFTDDKGVPACGSIQGAVEGQAMITGAQVRAARALLASFLLPIALSGVGHREAFSSAGKAAAMKVVNAYLAEGGKDYPEAAECR